MSQTLIPELARARPDTPTLSVIVPVYNEADAVHGFVSAMHPVLDRTGCDWQICFVNDGSTDSTLPTLLKMAKGSNRISVINLARNFGKESALTAGIDIAETDAVIIMDVDLQDPPSVISEFVKKWREGYDVIYGERISRKDDTFLKRFTAGWFYKVFNRISRTRIPENVGDFRLIDRRVVEAVKQLPERNRFMKGLFAWVGFPSTSVAFERAPRVAGQTKFRFRGLWNFALDGLLSFSTLPLKAWTYIGALLGVAAISYAGFIIARTVLFGIDVPGYSSLMVVVLTASAAQLLSLGIIGEYIARLTIETKRRPIYLVEGHYDRQRLLAQSEDAALSELEQHKGNEETAA
ncbi:MAG: glycosyltransferase family 2 protein [Pseudomonadota bacterium]